ncbi:TetR/AcrR family transcriptional regulator [Methanoregula sp.]|uniref:TetR/AcrR family transcriptional regulator n=1 Tax=Methanoregula sp. TaxID=2052170 RepID=UPI00262EE80E|nr:TetR/AcrR family transcriptional regulator [Methanoregula sp.]MDD5142316.1 TetR/AcrR family transcriptional regulator [Methanoregula sp.]
MREPSPDKQEAILETALTLFTERGFAGTPTSLISKEAGVATGTLFFYFKTKEELIDTLYRRVKSEAAKEMSRGIDKEKSAKAKLRRLGRNAAGWGMKNPAKLKFMEQFAHSPFVSTSAHEEGMSHFLFLEDLVRQGIQDGEIRNVEPSGLFCLMASALSGMIAHALSTGDRKERERIIEDGLDFIWFGMKA